LDSQTEKTVMELIEKLSREITILIIAHRVTSLKGCDQIIEIHKNNAIQIGSYEEMIKSNKKVDIE
jgi:ATP-binding cassette, subfamily B, bacterial PglK